MPLALTSAARVSEISFLEIKYLVKKHPSGHIFNFDKNTKTSKKGKSTNPIKFAPFEEKKNLCVYQHLFLKKTKEWHANESQLLLSFVDIHNITQSPYQQYLGGVIKG